MRMIAFTAYFDPDDDENILIEFEPDFDRNNHPGLMVRKLDVLLDIITQLLGYYNEARVQFGKSEKRPRRVRRKAYKISYNL